MDCDEIFGRVANKSTEKQLCGPCDKALTFEQRDYGFKSRPAVTQLTSFQIIVFSSWFVGGTHASYVVVIMSVESKPDEIKCKVNLIKTKHEKSLSQILDSLFSAAMYLNFKCQYSVTIYLTLLLI